MSFKIFISKRAAQDTKRSFQMCPVITGRMPCRICSGQPGALQKNIPLWHFKGGFTHAAMLIVYALTGKSR